jgi:hypothetical protein
MDAWVERELEGCEFPDKRLKTRFRKLLGCLSEKIGAALPVACQDWAATKAAYRFLSNSRVNESIILAGHFAATKLRIATTKSPILILHDTTEFSFQREHPEAIGKTRVIPNGRIKSIKDARSRSCFSSSFFNASARDQVPSVSNRASAPASLSRRAISAAWARVCVQPNTTGALSTNRLESSSESPRAALTIFNTCSF